MSDYDVVVIGAGPGGYVAAIRCAQLGMKVACVDAWRNANNEAALGGACLNVGCIPSKALLDSSHLYYSVRHDYAKHGITVTHASIDIPAMMARKDQIVATLTGGIAMLFVKHKIKWIPGHAALLSNSHIEVTTTRADEPPLEVRSRNIVIATGSLPSTASAIDIDGQLVVDSTAALAFDKVPKRFAVIGGGVVGLELGSVWNRLGAATTVLVRGARFLPNVEQQIADQALQALQQQGLIIKTGAKLVKVEKLSKTVKLTYTDANAESTQVFDKVLVATGRVPNTQHIRADAVGLELDERGFIVVDAQNRTNLENVYAIGDVVRGPMLAHKASEEGMAVAERLAGQACTVDFNTIPWVIYTWPEIAWVGKTSEQLRKVGHTFREGVFPFRGNGRAHAMGDTTGMVKILSDSYSDEILGVHIFGPNASDLIAEAVLAMEFKASAEDLARTVHAHPTLSEAVHEAALAVDNRAIHI